MRLTNGSISTICTNNPPNVLVLDGKRDIVLGANTIGAISNRYSVRPRPNDTSGRLCGEQLGRLFTFLKGIGSEA